MKKLNRRNLIAGLLGGAILIGGIGFASAHPGGGKGKRLEMLAEKLELTDSQKTEVKTIFQKKRDAFRALRDDESLDREARREKMRELKEGTRSELAEVLTPDQQAKFKELKAERRKKRGRKGHRGKGFGPERLERMAEKLGLSDDQKASMKSIFEDAKAERQAIIEAADGDRRAARPELRAHRMKVKGKIDAVLTAEQRTQLDEMKAKRKGRRGDKRGKRPAAN